MKKILFTLFMLTICLGRLCGQIPQAPKSLPSPTVAELGLYGEVPVSHFTGTPSIQIPLYDARFGQFHLPLTLSYHASGVRPDVHPGWLGMGWSLNAGGYISRVVHDMPDDYNNPAFYTGARAGFYFTCSILDNEAWNTRSYLRQVAQSTNDMWRDTEPDLFSFSFMGYSGQFALTHEGEWMVQCDKPVKVELIDGFLATPFSQEATYFESRSRTPTFAGFVLTAEDGTRYTFGGDTFSIEYSLNFFSQYYDEWIANTWHLRQIEYTNGQKVNFVYMRDGFINQMYLSIYEVLASRTASYNECSWFSFPTIENSYQGRLIAPVYLSRISTGDLVLDFYWDMSHELGYEERVYKEKYEAWLNTYDGHSSFLPFLNDNRLRDEYPACLEKLRWNKLSYIRIGKGMRQIIRTFNFAYNDLPTQRLMLQSVSESNEGTTGRVWQFAYNRPDLLPPYLSNMVDHWGFYNGTYASLNFTQYHLYREPNAACLQYGMLEKITYPTGGYTRFVFEPHTYRKQLSLERWEQCDSLAQNKMAGGLRIKQIIQSDTGAAADEKVASEYYYVSDYLANGANAGISSGVLGGTAQYYFADYEVEAFNDDNTHRWMRIFSSQSVLPGCENSAGSHVGYSEVIERKPDGTFIRYRYTNFDNGYMDEAPDAVIQEGRTPYEPYTSNAFMRGQLLSQEEYASDGTLKHRRNLTWGKSSNNYVRSMTARYASVCPTTTVSYDEGSAYRIYMGTPRITAETETWYDSPQQPRTIQTSYGYDAYNQLSRKSQVMDKLWKSTSYVRTSGSSAEVCQSMAEKHILSPIVKETESYILAQPLLITQGKTNQYTYVQPNASNPRLFVLGKAEQRIENGQFKTQYVCHSCNLRGYPVHVTKNDVDIVYLWGYRNRFLIAEIRNATRAEVESVIENIDSFSAAWTPSQQELNLLRESLPQAQITSFTYTPSGKVASITNPQGRTDYFEYDSLDRLKTERNYLGEVEKAYRYNYSSNQ